jgi:hypothetical protein
MTMALYLLNIMQPDGPPPAPEALAQIMADVGAMIAETRAAKAWVFDGGLAPQSSSTVVRTVDGAPMITDGPYAEAKEFIGGFVIVRAADIDEALVWGAKISRATTLPIEVRAFSYVGE